MKQFCFNLQRKSVLQSREIERTIESGTKDFNAAVRHEPTGS